MDELNTYNEEFFAAYESVDDADNFSDNDDLKTQIVAQAIVDDEMQSSYKWVFKCVVGATGLVPNVLVTDSNPAVNELS
ncbi:protein far1-related sequence 5-like [Gigaspora margarita]|uniref:Protein far1-related sequence 5-like n=1 Tax=Gigaspora margarita TaxID=4874 RepID=A0A8H3XK39_GIGMA|nr:protein far1-related sequence 5-like [Gigaspora margarita]